MSTNIAGVPIDFGPIVQEPDDVSSITGKYQMPCGCKLTQKVINKGSFGSSVATEEFIDMAKKRLIYWFEKRIPWHQCHLVASENPNGIISKDLRSNRTPPFGYLLESGQVGDVSIEREIQAKGLTAPRLRPSDLDANIAHTDIVKHISKSGQVLRWAVLTTLNGFAVTGKPSASVSPENDDAEIGEKVAFDNARAELWPLMGYALKDRLFQYSLIKCEVGKVLGVQIVDGDKPAIPPHQQRVIDEKRELDDKLGKLDQFINGSALFDGLPSIEQDDLIAQHGHMAQYSRYLASRIARFGGAA